MRGVLRVRMAYSSYVATPMFVGILRPVIVLPQFAYVRNGMDKELTNILCHELTHYRRKDVLYKWLVVAVTSLHWFNPLMLWIRKEISRACELSCDEAVISGMSASEKQFYGNTLLTLSANKKLLAGILSTTLCEEKNELKERLISIMKYKKKSAWAIALTFFMALLLAGCGATLGVANSTNSESPKYKLLETDVAAESQTLPGQFLQKLESATDEKIIGVQYDDFDGDRKREAFVITGKGNLNEGGDLWFVSENEVIKLNNMYLYSPPKMIQIGDQKLIKYEEEYATGRPLFLW